MGLADSLSNDPSPGRGRSGEQVTADMAQSHNIAESADGQARLEPCDRIKSSHIEGVEESRLTKSAARFGAPVARRETLVEVINISPSPN
jgi:hypothetical protein